MQMGFFSYYSADALKHVKPALIAAISVDDILAQDEATPEKLAALADNLKYLSPEVKDKLRTARLGDIPKHYRPLLQVTRLNEFDPEHIKTLDELAVQCISAESISRATEEHLQALGKQIVHLSEAARAKLDENLLTDEQRKLLLADAARHTQHQEQHQEQHQAASVNAEQTTLPPPILSSHQAPNGQSVPPGQPEQGRAEPNSDIDEVVKELLGTEGNHPKTKYSVLIGMPGAGKTCMLDILASMLGKIAPKTIRTSTALNQASEFEIPNSNAKLIDTAGENFKSWYLKASTRNLRDSLDDFLSGSAVAGNVSGAKDDAFGRLISHAQSLFICIPAGGGDLTTSMRDACDFFNKQLKEELKKEIKRSEPNKQLTKQDLDNQVKRKKIPKLIFLFNHVDKFIYPQLNKPHTNEARIPRMTQLLSGSNFQDVDSYLNSNKNLDSEKEQYINFYTNKFYNLRRENIFQGKESEPLRKYPSSDAGSAVTNSSGIEYCFYYLLYYPHLLDRYRLLEQNPRKPNGNLMKFANILHNLDLDKEPIKEDHKRLIAAYRNIFELEKLRDKLRDKFLSIFWHAKKNSPLIKAVVPAVILAAILTFIFLTVFPDKIENRELKDNAQVVYSLNTKVGNQLQVNPYAGMKPDDLKGLFDKLVKDYEKEKPKSYNPVPHDDAIQGAHRGTCHSLFNSNQDGLDGKYGAFLSSFYGPSSEINQVIHEQNLAALQTFANGLSGSQKTLSSTVRPGSERQDCTYKLIEEFWKPRIALASMNANDLKAVNVNALKESLSKLKQDAAFTNVANIQDNIDRELPLLEVWSQQLSTGKYQAAHIMVDNKPAKVPPAASFPDGRFIIRSNPHGCPAQQNTVESTLCDHMRNSLLDDKSNINAFASLTIDELNTPENLEEFCKGSSSQCKPDPLRLWKYFFVFITVFVLAWIAIVSIWVWLLRIWVWLLRFLRKQKS